MNRVCSTGADGQIVPPALAIGLALPIALVDPRARRRQRLLRVLAECGFRAFGLEAVSASPQAALVLVHLGTDDPEMSTLAAAVSDLCEVPVAVVSDADNPHHAAHAIRSGLSGFIPSTLRGPGLIAAINLIAAGGLFLSASAIAWHVAARSAGRQRRAEGLSLSRREDDVLERLLSGKPNKIIAHELSISQATVKVHVRNIMRKLGVTNRTQIVSRTLPVPLFPDPAHVLEGT